MKVLVSALTLLLVWPVAGPIQHAGNSAALMAQKKGKTPRTVRSKPTKARTTPSRRSFSKLPARPPLDPAEHEHARKLALSATIPTGDSQRGLDHIIHEHGSNSTVPNKGRFGADVDITTTIESAL